TEHLCDPFPAKARVPGTDAPGEVRSTRRRRTPPAPCVQALRRPSRPAERSARTIAETANRLRGDRETAPMKRVQPADPSTNGSPSSRSARVDQRAEAVAGLR